MNYSDYTGSNSVWGRSLWTAPRLEGAVGRRLESQPLAGNIRNASSSVFEFKSRDDTVGVTITSVSGSRNIQVIIRRLKNEESTDLSLSLDRDRHGNQNAFIGINFDYERWWNGNYQRTYENNSTNILLQGMNASNVATGIIPAWNIRRNIEAPPQVRINPLPNINHVVGQSLADPSTYVTVDNRMTGGSLTYSWVNRPDVSTIGVKTGTIQVRDQLGQYVRTATTTVTFNVTGHNVTLRAEPTVGGVVSASKTTNFNPGEETTIHAQANSGYRFIRWEVSGAGSQVTNTNNATTQFRMGTANATVVAIFEPHFLAVDANRPQVLLGANPNQVNLKDWVSVRLNGVDQLPQSAYEVTIINNEILDTTLARTQSLRVRVSYGDLSTEVTVPVTIIWGSTINISGSWSGSSDFRSIAAYTLHPGQGITYVPGQGASSLEGASLPQVGQAPFSRFSLLSSAGGDPIVIGETASTFEFETLGSESPNYLIDKFKEQSGGQNMVFAQAGDVVESWHIYHSGQEIAGNSILSGRTWNTLYKDENRVDESEGLNTVYYEVMSDHFRPLSINRVKVKEGEGILYNTTEAQLDQWVEEYLELPTGVVIKGFIEYPNRSQVGSITTGIIRVEELLENGGTIQMDYEVSFEIMGDVITPKDLDEETWLMEEVTKQAREELKNDNLSVENENIPYSFLTKIEIINLTNTETKGTIPPSINKLINLKILRLDNNQMTGSIPDSLANLVFLQTCDLSHNQLTGHIPKELEGLVSLQSLVLNNNQLTGSIPNELGALINLKELSLHMNQLTGTIPESLGTLTNLTVLNLSQNQLTGNVPSNIRSDIITTDNNYLANLPNQNSLIMLTQVLTQDIVELDIGDSIDLLTITGNALGVDFSPTLEWEVIVHTLDIVNVDDTTITATNYGRIDVVLSIKGSADTGNDNAKINFPIWVRNAVPVLTVTNPMHLQLGEALDYLQGVEALDYRGNAITATVEWDIDIDTSRKGIHTITYRVEDRGYSVSQQRVVIVGDYVVGDRYIYDIQDFMVFKQDIEGSDTELLEKSKVAAWYVETGQQIDTSLLEVRNNGGYQAQVGEYTFAVAVQGETEEIVTATVEVVSRDIEVSVPVKMMFAVFASDGGNVTAPEYEIVNHSSLPINVSLSSFNGIEAAGIMLVHEPPKNDNELQLQLLGETNFTTIGSLPTTGYLGRLAKNRELASSGSFTFGGNYRGRFGTPKEPRFQAVFQFELILPEGLE